jgi:hypothetical protein
MPYSRSMIKLVLFFMLLFTQSNSIVAEELGAEQLRVFTNAYSGEHYPEIDCFGVDLDVDDDTYSMEISTNLENGSKTFPHVHTDGGYSISIEKFKLNDSIRIMGGVYKVTNVEVSPVNRKVKRIRPETSLTLKKIKIMLSMIRMSI